jgi:hypothetical protein
MKKILLIFIILNLYSCQFIGNKLNKMVGEYYFDKYSYRDTEYIDEIVRLVFENPYDYKDSLQTNKIEDLTLTTNLEYINKYTNYELELCMHHLYQYKQKQRIDFHIKGALVYNIEGTNKKLCAYVEQEKKDSELDITIVVFDAKNCKFWEWDIESPFY